MLDMNKQEALLDAANLLDYRVKRFKKLIEERPPDVVLDTEIKLIRDAEVRLEHVWYETAERGNN